MIYESPVSDHKYKCQMRGVRQPPSLDIQPKRDAGQGLAKQAACGRSLLTGSAAQAIRGLAFVSDYPTSPSGRVRIATPLRLDDEAVRLFAISRLPWIKKQRSRFENQERETRREFVTGESHYFEGNRYLLNVIYQNTAPKVEIRNKKYIDLYVRPNSTTEQRERVMTRWYRQRLKEKIPALIEKWQTIIGVQVNGWEVKQMKTRWGTCKREAGLICLNLELAKKPARCLEYIIVHELIHLKVRHRNEQFIALMDKFMPQWRFYQSKLNQSMLSYDDWNY